MSHQRHPHDPHASLPSFRQEGVRERAQHSHKLQGCLHPLRFPLRGARLHSRRPMEVHGHGEQNPIINYHFHDLPSPGLILGPEAYNDLFNKNCLLVPKFGGWGGGQQFFKILMSRLWQGVPPLGGYPTGIGRLRKTPSRAFSTPRARSSSFTRGSAIGMTHLWCKPGKIYLVSGER